ncbi:MAG: inositol monophosphatase family protein [Anaerolineales bacterium]|jgi:myo-inositol-1(or 4)-monophosphatase
MNPTLSDLEQLARQSGEILRLGYGREHQVNYKHAIDPVTEVDRQSEKLLLGEIQSHFPGHQIVSEEAGLVPGRIADQWFVDPLDGTVNYAHGIPIFCVSIAYAHEGGVTLGVIYDPMRDELFSAERGQGAWCNGTKIQVSSVKDIRRSLLVTGFPYDAWTTEHDNLDNFGRFARITQGVRRLGSAALDLCYVAAGRFDGYWELTLNPWDLAAGGLIASEAGAVVTNLDGQKDILIPPCSLLATTPGLYPKMLEVLNDKS